MNYARVLNRTVFTPRIYIHSKTDDLSVGKAKCLEDSNKAGTAEYVAITRAREVGQSWISSIFTTLKATVDSFWILLKWTPDLVSHLRFKSRFQSNVVRVPLIDRLQRTRSLPSDLRSCQIAYRKCN